MGSFFQVTVRIVGVKEAALSFDLSLEQLQHRVLQRRAAGQPVTLSGRTVDWDHIQSIKIVETPAPVVDVVASLNARRQQQNRESGIAVLGGGYSRSDVAAGSGGQDVTDWHISEPPGQLSTGSTPEPVEAPGRKRKVMLVVGRERPVNRAMENWLRAIGLEPMEWAKLKRETGSASPFIGEVLDRAFQVAQAVVVLMTPDDVVRLRPDLAEGGEEEEERRWTAQPRPNVLFEAGMAFATHPTRTAIVEVTRLRGLSDLNGRHTIRLTGVRELRDLAGLLEAAGCAVDDSGGDWLDFDEFKTALPTEKVKSALQATAGSAPVAAGAPDNDALQHELRDFIDDFFVQRGDAVSDRFAPEVAQRLVAANSAADVRDAVWAPVPGSIRVAHGTLKRLDFELQEAEYLERATGAEHGYTRGARLRGGRS